MKRLLLITVCVALFVLPFSLADITSVEVNRTFEGGETPFNCDPTQNNQNSAGGGGNETDRWLEFVRTGSPNCMLNENDYVTDGIRFYMRCDAHKNQLFGVYYGAPALGSVTGNRLFAIECWGDSNTELRWQGATTQTIIDPVQLDEWFEIVIDGINWSNGNISRVYYRQQGNGTIADLNDTNFGYTSGSFSGWYGRTDSSSNWEIDQLLTYNGTLFPLPEAQIVQVSYNVTSADENGTAWQTSTSNEVTTVDPTSTVKFNVTPASNCTISPYDWSYSDVAANDSNYVCATVDTNAMTCTSPYALSTGVQSIYIACRTNEGVETVNSTSGALAIKVLDAENSARSYIESGITTALSAPTIYTGQQIYLRLKNGTEKLAAFDKVAVQGNKRWAFNYVTSGESYTGMWNLSPVLYVYELENKTLSDIKASVEQFINGTLN